MILKKFCMKPAQTCSTRLGVGVRSKLRLRSLRAEAVAIAINTHYDWIGKTLQRDYHAGSLSSEDFGKFPLGVSYKNLLEPIFLIVI